MRGKYIMLLLYLVLVSCSFGDEFTEYHSVAGMEGDYLGLSRLVVIDDAVVTLECELLDPFSEEKKKLVVVGGISAKNNIDGRVFYCSGMALDQIKVHWEDFPNNKFRLTLVITNDSSWKGQWSVIVEANKSDGGKGAGGGEGVSQKE